METLAGKALNDIADLVAHKWYSGMGLFGLLILMWTLLKGTPHDDTFVALIGVTMFALGFAEAESRTAQVTLDYMNQGTRTKDARKFTLASTVLYIVGLAAASGAAYRAWTLWI